MQNLLAHVEILHVGNLHVANLEPDDQQDSEVEGAEPTTSFLEIPAGLEAIEDLSIDSGASFLGTTAVPTLTDVSPAGVPAQTIPIESSVAVPPATFPERTETVSPSTPSDISTSSKESSPFISQPSPLPARRRVNMANLMWPHFAGRSTDNIGEYIEEIEATLALAGVDNASQDAVFKTQFRRGLRGDAKAWWEAELGEKEKTGKASITQAARAKWETTRIDSNIISDIVGLRRRFEESVDEYFRRAEKLFVRVKSKELRSIAAGAVLNGMVRDDQRVVAVDKGIKQRLEDRLMALGHVTLTSSGAKEFSASFAEIKKSVRSLGVEMGAYEESDGEEDSMVKLKDVAKLFKQFPNLGIGGHQQPQTPMITAHNANFFNPGGQSGYNSNTGYNSNNTGYNSGTSGYNTGGNGNYQAGTPGTYYNGGNYNNGQSRPLPEISDSWDPRRYGLSPHRTYWCDNCASPWGDHMDSQCPLPRVENWIKMANRRKRLQLMETDNATIPSSNQNQNHQGQNQP